MLPSFANNMDMTELLGLVGAAIAVLAYLPQILHLAKEHCTAGISRWAFSLWLLSSILITIHAVKLGDLVFITLGSAQIVLISVILYYCSRYQGQYCAVHIPAVKKRS